MVDDVFKHFGDANIHAFGAVWPRNKKFDTHYKQYLANLANNMAPEEAAFNTWIGQGLKRRGFNKVTVPAHGARPDVVMPVFTR